jgi:uncharacterized peroxidase-related enzyme
MSHKISPLRNYKLTINAVLCGLHSENLGSQARSFDPASDLGERGIPRSGRIVRERRKSAIVGRTEGLDRNDLRGFQHAVPHLFGRFDPRMDWIRYPDKQNLVWREKLLDCGEPSPLSSGLRELIAAYTSYTNKCEFCTKSHVAIAAELLGSEESVWSAVRDLEGSSLSEKEKALLRYVARVTRNLPSVAEDDAQTLRNVGWTDADIYYALTVCSLFNFYNRWVTGSGVHAVSHEGHLVRAKVMAQNGYVRK